MADQGRWSANQVMVMAGILVLTLTSQFMATHAAEFTVGDDEGWRLGIENWPQGKTFHAGDVLIFKYDDAFHNLAIVDSNSYNTCIAGPSSKIFTSGNDRVTLPKGDHFFVCTFPSHCANGMKIKVTAT